MSLRRFLSLAAFLVSVSTALSYFSPEPRSRVSPLALAPPAVASAPGRPTTNLSAAGKRRALEAFAKLPLYFESNAGQTDASVKFLSRGPGYGLFLDSTGAWFSLKGAQGDPVAFRVHLDGANPAPQIAGVDEQAGKTNYFIGNDPRLWRTNVSTFRKVKYEGVYPGVDLVYYGNQQQLEYDFVVAPGADPRAIRMSFSGAERLEINAQGDLEVRTGGAEVLYRKPQVYQPEKGSSEGRKTVEGNFVLAGDSEVAFQVGAYDGSQPLVIDPPMNVFSTFLGGSVDDGAFGIAVDGAGNAYVTGGTTSTQLTTPNPFPVTAGSFQTTSGGVVIGCGKLPTFRCGDAFVTKIDPTGATLIYSTYLGGSNVDSGFGIAVDANGNAYVSGTTRSTNFPTTPSGFQTTASGTQDAFVAKLNPAGSALLYSTYLGGSANSSGFSLALDSSNNVYLAAQTISADFPVTAGVFQSTCISCTQPTPQTSGVVVKINPTLSGFPSLVYSTFIGGTQGESLSGIAVDSAGNAYVVGGTTSTDLTMVPNPNPIQPLGFAGGGTACATTVGYICGDAYVAKINPTATALVYLTYLGGSGEDSAIGIAVDAQGNAYVTGGTESSNFPTTTGAFQATYGGGSAGCATTGAACGDAFVTKINPAGTALVYSTFLGGSGDDLGIGVQVDQSGNAYVVGVTNSTTGAPGSDNFPVTANALGPGASFGGGTFPCSNGQFCGDGFLTILDPTGSRALLSTYSGSTGDDVGTGIALDTFGDAYSTGFTNSANFFTGSGPTGTGPVFQNTYGGGADDAFVAKISLFTLSACTNTFTGGAGTMDWGTAANWATGLLPDAFDNVCLGTNNVTLSAPLPSGNQAVTSITATGGTLTISGGSLTIAHAFSTPTSTLNNVNISGGTLGTSFGTTINGTLTMGFGTLTIDPSTLTVAGLTSFTGGATINGTAGSMLSANGGLSITGSIIVDTVSLVNNSANGSMSGFSTIMSLSNGAVFNNPAGATFDVMDGNGIRSGSGASGFINNFGIFTKSIAGATATGIFAPLTNNTGGTVSVGAGTLELTGPGSTGTGNYTVAPGAFLQLSAQSLQSGHNVSGMGTVIFSGTPSSLMGGTYNVAGTTTFSPAGTMTISTGETVTLGTSMFNSGTVTFGPAVTFNPLGTTSPMTISGGTVNFSTGQTGGVSLSAVNFTIGSVAGFDPITITGALNWTSGTFQNSAGVTVTGGTTLSGTGTTGTIAAGTFNSNSTFTQSGTAILDIENAAVLSVPAGATYNANSPGGITTATTGNMIVMGTVILADPPTGLTPIVPALSFFGNALLNVETGDWEAFRAFVMCPTGTPGCTAMGSVAAGSTLNLLGASTVGMGGSVTNNGTINDSGGTTTFASGSTATGTGTLNITNTTTVMAGAIVAIANVNVQSGGTLNGAGSVGSGAAPSTVTNSGTVSPGIGMSPGSLTINGSYMQGAAGLLNTVIGGLTPGTQYSQLGVTGNVSFAGTITGLLINGFVPAVGNSIQPVVLLGTITGTFTTNTLQAPGADTWQLTYIPDTSPQGSVTATLAASAAADFTLSAMPSPLTVDAGTSGNYTVTVAPLNGFTGNVVLSVTGLPAGATFTPATINGGTGSAMLSISTAASTPAGSFPLTITGTSGALSHTASVTLVVTQPVVALATNLNFGPTVAVGSSRSQLLSLTNSGPGPLTFAASGAFSITGANAAAFSQMNTCPVAPATLAAGLTCTITVTFTPAAPDGTKGATLTVTDNGSNSPQTVALSGQGATVTANLSATSINFGAVPVGTQPSPTMPVRVSSSVNIGLNITNITITGANAADFKENDNCNAEDGGIGADSSCTITVTFTPTVTTIESATLTITDNAPTPGSQQTVSLVGGMGAGFTLTVPPPPSGGTGFTISVLPGDTAIYTLLVTCTPGVTGTVTLAGQAPLPPNTILTITPSTITCPSAAPVTVKVMLQTNCVPSLVAPFRPAGPGSGPGSGLPGSFAALWVAAILLAAGMRRSGSFGKRQGWQVAPVCAALLLMILVMTWTACVSNLPPALPNQPTTPAGTYPIVIVGTGPSGGTVVLTLSIHVI